MSSEASGLRQNEMRVTLSGPNASNGPLKCHLCPVRLLIWVSSVTPAVEKEVDSSSLSILPRGCDELSGCSASTSAAGSRKDNGVRRTHHKRYREALALRDVPCKASIRASKRSILMLPSGLL